MSADPFFDVTVTRSGREEHVLRLGREEPLDESCYIEDPPDHTGPGGLERLERWLKDRGVTRWGGGKGAPLLAYARQAEALGISAVNLLSEALTAEHDVLDFERRTGKTLGWERFPQIMGTVRQLAAEHSAIDEEARAIAGARVDSDPRAESFGGSRKHRETLAAREARLEERRKNLEEKRNALGEDWKALGILNEILRHVPRALACWRVRYALGWLRAPWLLRTAAKDLPRELGPLLGRLGRAIADPPKVPRAKEEEAEGEE